MDRRLEPMSVKEFSDRRDELGVEILPKVIGTRLKGSPRTAQVAVHYRGVVTFEVLTFILYSPTKRAFKTSDGDWVPSSMLATPYTGCVDHSWVESGGTQRWCLACNMAQDFVDFTWRDRYE